MSRSLKKCCLAILLIFSLQKNARAQQEFIDSIRNMLTDLDSSIQFPQINRLLRNSITYCYGHSMNDSLTHQLKQLITEDYLFAGGLQQAVSPHLITRYAAFLVRISFFIAEHGGAENYSDNMVRVGVAMLNAAREKQHSHLLPVATTIFSKEKFDRSYASATRLYYLAKTYAQSFKHDSCYTMFRKALEFNPRENTEEENLYANTLYSFAAHCYGNNKRDTAFKLFQEQLKLRKMIYGENSSEYAYWMIVTADHFTYLSKYNLAQELNFKALELTSRTLGNETSQYALCLNDIGEVYYRNGEYDKALPYAQRSLAIKQRIFGKKYFDNVVSLHNLATIYTRMGLYNEAIPLLQESLDISKKYFGEKIVYAFDLSPLAEVYTAMGEYEKALPLYHRSIEIQKQLQKEEGGDGKNFYYAGVLHNIANLYTKLGQYGKATDLFKHTLQIKKDLYGELNPEYAKTLNSYAEVSLFKGDYQTALSLQLQSLSSGKKMFGNSHPNIATGLYNLAALYYARNNFSKAAEACAKALLMQEKIFHVNHPDVAASLDLMGDIMRQTNRDEQALKYFQKAFDIRKGIVANTHPSYTTSLYNLGLINYKNGDVAKAAKLFMNADSAALLHIQQSYLYLSEEEKSTYLHKAESQFNLLPSLLFCGGVNDSAIANGVYANAIALKSMVLFHQQQVYNSIRKSGHPASIEVYNQWRFNKALIGQQLLLPAKSRISNFDSLTEVTTHLEEQLSRLSGSFSNISLQIQVNQQTIQQKLNKNEAAIEFVRFRLFRRNWTDSTIYAALVLLPGRKNAVFIRLFEERQLKKLLRFSSNGGEASINYLYPARNKETSVSNELYRLVWAPLQSTLKGTHTIYYSPVGLLSKLSFAAISSGSGRFLSDTYSLRQLLCTRTLALKDNNTTVYSSASLWGNIDYERDGTDGSIDTVALPGSFLELHYPAKNWRKLPGTKAEIENISMMLKEKNIPASNETGPAANEGAFKNMDGRSASIIHAATHGFFLPATVYPSGAMFRSGLLLAGSNKSWNHYSDNLREDGVLTAYEISHLDLSNTLLVILSACETGLGDIEYNEGVYGLQRGFKMAGVKQVLMSLWTVPDNETTELMLLFYNNLLKENDAYRALQQAQLSMNKKLPPYYWAGFVLTE